MQGTATFPGVEDITRATMTLSHGITPSVCTMVTVPQESFFSQTGTLRFVFGDTEITFPNSAIRSAQLSTGGEGQRWTLSIVDRRWRWQYGVISGRYNTVREDGKIEIGTRKTPRQLAELLLIAMGEQRFAVGDIPNRTRPEVVWDASNPAQELASLCDELGCRVVLGLDDRVRIVRVSIGSNLPRIGVETTESFAITPSIEPRGLRVVGAPILVQSKLKLEAVGEDTDGKIKPINSLSYKPSGGWTGTIPETFASVTNTYFQDGLRKARDLALKTVFRMYRVISQADGTQRIPLSTRVGSIKQLLPLNDYRASTNRDDLGVTRFDSPYIDGVWWPRGRDYSNVSDRIYAGDFVVDGARGLVIFSEPITKLTTDLTQEAALIFLTTSYEVSDITTHEKIRYKRDRVLKAGARDADAMILRHPDLLLRTIMTYANDINIIGSETNKAFVDSAATAYLDIAESENIRVVASDRQYAGLVAIEPDGAIQQVSWSVGSGAAMTTASRNKESDISIESHKTRRRKELVDKFVAKEQIRAPVRR